MSKNLKALIWLRLRQIISNKTTFIPLSLPYLLVFLYSYLKNGEEPPIYILFMVTTVSLSLTVTTLVSTLVADEKEKNNIRTLRLSGISGVEYILSIITFPVLFLFVTYSTLPFLIKVNLEHFNYLKYTLTSSYVAFVLIMINLYVGLKFDTQQKVSAISVPLMMFTSLFPAFYSVNNITLFISKYSFLNLYIDFFDAEKLLQLSFWDKYLVSMFWILLSIILNVRVYKTDL